MEVICGSCEKTLFEPSSDVKSGGSESSGSDRKRTKHSKSTNIYATSCGHLVHKSCLTNWLKEHESDSEDFQCPQCRKTIEPDGVFKIFPLYGEVQKVVEDEVKVIIVPKVSLHGSDGPKPKPRPASRALASLLQSFDANQEQSSSVMAAAQEDFKRLNLQAEQEQNGRRQIWEQKLQHLDHQLETSQEAFERRQEDNNRRFEQYKRSYDETVGHRWDEFKRNLDDLNRDVERANKELENKNRTYEIQQYSMARQKEWETAKREFEQKSINLKQRQERLETRRKQLESELSQRKTTLERDGKQMDSGLESLRKDVEKRQQELFQHLKSKP